MVNFYFYDILLMIHHLIINKVIIMSITQTTNFTFMSYPFIILILLPLTLLFDMMLILMLLQTRFSYIIIIT